MIVALAATQMEMAPFLKHKGESESCCLTLVGGIGPVESTVSLARFLSHSSEKITGVVQFGVAGAYRIPEADNQPSLLSVCLAQREVNGDFGIALNDELQLFSEEIAPESVIELPEELIAKVEQLLSQRGITIFQGTFVTVNSASGTDHRGKILQEKWQGLCENMEGFSVARVCKEYDIPLLEMRVISNMVEDRNLDNWKLSEACQLAGELAAFIIKEL